MEIVLIYSTRIVIFEVKNLNYENELHSEAQRTKRYRSKRILTFTIIMTVIASLILVPTFTSAVAPNQSLSPQAYSCSGNAYQTYSGQVLDQEQYGLGGVVLYFFTPGIYVGGSTATVKTDSSGDWSVQLISCVYDSDLYWQSMTDGPYLTEETNVPASGSSYTVNVWEQTEYVNLTYEFMHSPYAKISIAYSTTTEVSVNAYVSGSISVGFLGVNAAGNVGTTVQVLSGVQVTGNTQFAIQYAEGIMTTVEADNGSVLAYFQPYNISSSTMIDTGKAIDYMTAGQAWQLDNASGIPAFEKLTSGTSVNYTKSYSTTVTLDTNLSMHYGLPVGGLQATFGIEVGTATGTSQTITTTFTDPANSSLTYCFLVYQGGSTIAGEGPVLHTWLYSTNTGDSCP